MTWQPGQPVTTTNDCADWQAWRKARKLEQQRARRQSMPRIDYYPSRQAIEAICARMFPHVDGDFGSVIDRLVLAGAAKLPE
jgi:hypothetical protein